MRHLVRNGLAAAAVMTLPLAAQAADLKPVYKVVPVPVFTWTGCYIGGNVGYGWQKTDNTLTIANGTPGYFAVAAIPGVQAAGSGRLESDGFTGGGQIGCNFQSGQVVWGAETDFNSFRQGARYGGRFFYTTNGAPYNLNVSDDKRWLWTLRGRVGIAVNRAMFYVTGGVAVAKFEFNQDFSEPPFTSAPLGTPELATTSKNKAGWTVGFGAEAEVWDCWSIKAEYLYARLDSDTATGFVTGLGAGGANSTASFTNSIGRIDLNIVRLGLNYRFGWTPVVTKY